MDATPSFPRIAVLIDLSREAGAGGHVKYWERLSEAAARASLPIDVTIYFSGEGADDVLSPRLRYRYLPPVFSTERLKFLPYIPAHTDLAPFHTKLAAELSFYDLIHTTDAYFAYARTAERVAAEHKIPLVTSFHTDTPAYTELFTRQTLRSLFGPRLASWANRTFKIAPRQRIKKEKRLALHLQACKAILVLRAEDKILAQDKARPMRLGVDKDVFAPSDAARAAVEQAYHIPPNRFIVLFVGRIDAGKNLPTLMQACRQAIDEGVPLHLILAGTGPMEGEVKQKMGDHASLAGFVPAEKLAQLYAASDCLAIASDIEIGGMIGLEALACGCPVLVSRQSGIAHLFGYPQAMMEVESGTGFWTKALTDYARDRQKQRRMRDAALAFRHNRLAGWDEIMREDFLAVWQEILRLEA